LTVSASTHQSTERKLRNGIVSLAILSGLAVALVLSIPGLRSAAERFTDADPALLAVAIALEALSCAGYVVLFELIFGGLSARLRWRLPLAELAVNSVVSAGGLGGIAVGAWVLRSKGLSLEGIARRSVSLFLLTSAVNATAVVLIGIPMWLGWLPGSRDPLLTLAPAVVSSCVIVGVLALGAWARRLGASERARRATAVARAVGEGVRDSLDFIASRDWRLLGAVGYWLCDNLVLYVAIAAFGHAPSFWVVAMAYLVGMLANALPIPGGFVAIEGGLVGMLVLFGVRPVSVAIVAVVTYRAISLWFPSLVGTLAFAAIRHEIGTPLTPVEPAAAD
jgi:uncharacterized membrane protein YbhN (UPF0104 family)